MDKLKFDNYEYDEISEQVWVDNYKGPLEKTRKDTWDRAAKACAAVEHETIRENIENDFKSILYNDRFVPGGRILANLGIPDRVGTTQYNCLRGSTKIHTKDGIKFAKDLYGEVEVLSQDGVYRKSYWKAFGYQKLFEITLKNGDKLYATEGHQWLVKNNKGKFKRITTNQLLNNFIPFVGRKTFEYEETSFKEGIKNGLIFGDGTLYFNGRYSLVQQFGTNKHLIHENFENTTYWNSSKGAVATLNPPEYKNIPSIEEYNLSYLRGFIAGCIASDGHVDNRGSVTFYSSNIEHINKIREISTVCGLPTSGIRLFREKSPYDGSYKPNWCLTFIKKWFDDKLIIKNTHKQNWANSKKSNKDYSCKVVSVIDTGIVEEVYCCEEPETHSFVIDNLYLTGNCFVHNPEDLNMKDADSIEGIYNLLKAQAKTLKSEGGYGINASFIRPAGAYIKGIGSRTPGVLKFMELWDKSSEIITQGSVKILGKKHKNEKNKIRKGAQMLILEVWHPDIKDFIIAKQTPGRLTKFNVSVGITKGFMQAVVANEDWVLKYPDTTVPAYKEEWFGDIYDWESKGHPVIVHETVKAVELWELITKSTYNRNEPGVLFLDLANKLNPVYWFDKIKTTNPCFAGDTLIAVADGRNVVSIKQLAEEGKDVPVYSLNKESGLIEIKTARNPRITGYNKKLVRVTLDNGSHFDVTPDHKCLLKNGKTVLAKDLQYGDSLPRFTKTKKTTVKNGKPYWQIYCDINNFYSKNKVFEHRLIAEFNNPELWKQKYSQEKQNGWHKGGLVVHHKDYNGLNNSPSNLEIMTFKEHQQFHAEHDCVGENNGRFYGKTSNEIKEHALQLTKNLGRRFSKSEWKVYSKEHKLPRTFSKMHHNVLGQSPTELASICAIELGFENSVNDTRLLITLKNILQQGYKAKIIDNQVFVEKTCEGCSVVFSKPYEKREIAYCSNKCYKQHGMNKYYGQKIEKTKESQARIWSKLKFKLKREPNKTEWINACKSENIPIRLGGSKNSFQNYKDIVDAGLNYNHKVISVEELPGEHTVYNLTVDDNHTVSIITKENKKEHSELGPTFTGINLFNCGEVPMSTGVCNLGSLNLVTFVKEIEGKLVFDYKEFHTAVTIAIRFLDNINSISSTPLPEYDQSVREKRRIGLGVMGLGSLHLMLGIKYGSPESLQLVEKIFKEKCEAELWASAILGEEKGSFPKFDKEKYFSSVWWNQLRIDEDVKKDIEKLGCMRNSHQSMNAPTGNTGIYARNVSGGIEPVFNADGYYRWSIVPEFRRRELIEKGFKYPDVGNGEWFETEFVKFAQRGDEQVLAGTFEGKRYEIDKNRGLVVATLVEDYGMRFAKNYYGDHFEALKASGAFTSSENLSIAEHLSVLAICSHYTNMAISKTVNIPNDYSYEDFQKVYMYAYENGIKGITTYRAGTMTTVIESKEDNVKTKQKPLFTENHAPKRNKELPCDIIHATVNGEKWTFIVGLYEDKPYEIFGGLSKFVQIPKRIKTGKVIKQNSSENNIAKYNLHYDFEKGPEDETVIKDITSVFENKTNAAFTRTVSLSLRHGVPIQYVVEQLTKGSEKEDELFSFSRAVSRVLKNYIKDGTKTSVKKCPECSSERLIYKEGCAACLDCNHSKC